MDKANLRRAPLLITAVAVLSVILGACSGTSSSDAPPSGQGGNSSTAQAGAAQFAQCMRQKGVTNFPDPQNGRFLLPGSVRSNPHFNSAIQACQHFLGPGGIGSNNPQNQQAILGFVHCMRTHGVPNMPEPAANGALQAPQGQGIDANSPAFQKAFSECKSKLPGNGHGLKLDNGNGQQG